MNRLSRRSFLKTAGAATGVAVISASPAVAAALEPGAVETTPTGPVSREPVVAIVRNESHDEVTVMSGTTEKTYKDRALVKRLQKIARQHESTGGS